MKVTKSQEFISEFFGTVVLIPFGCGSVAMVVLFGSQPPISGEVVKGGYTNIMLGSGLAVAVGIYVAGTISGAHINPAVNRFSPRSRTICGALSTGQKKGSQFWASQIVWANGEKSRRVRRCPPTARSFIP